MGNVLIADDDAGVRDLLRVHLEDLGHTVRETRSANEVFQAIDVERPDILLLDVHLGSDDGLGVGLGLRKQPEMEKTTIVFMTGTLDNPELERLRLLVRAEILEKPFDFDALARAVGH